MGDILKRKLNIKCISKVLDHLELASLVSGTLMYGRTPFFQEIFPDIKGEQMQRDPGGKKMHVRPKKN